MPKGPWAYLVHAKWFWTGPNIENLTAWTKCLHGHFGQDQMTKNHWLFLVWTKCHMDVLDKTKYQGPFGMNQKSVNPTNFPFRTFFAASHGFWFVVFPFSFVSRYDFYFFFGPLVDQECVVYFPPICEYFSFLPVTDF